MTKIDLVLVHIGIGIGIGIGIDFDYREESETEEESGESEEESSNEDKVNQTFLTCLKKGTDIKKLDWCGYLLKCLKRTKTLWKGGLFNGPSTFLTVLYAQKYMPVVLKRSSTTVITKWTARKLIMFQKEMIASNKKIIAHDTDIESHEITAPDTDIESHEIIAAKTTPKKERMTKSKIIAAKKSHTASGLTSKLTMLEVLMNGIACDLEKAIQQHRGNKEIENIKLLWKEKLLKRASEMNKKDKERHCEQVFKFDRGMEVKGEQNNQEMERPGKHIFEVDRDKQGASRLKDMDVQNKSERRDWAKHSNISSLTPKTLCSLDEQFDPVKAVSTVEDHSLVLPANDIPSFYLGLTPTPPDVYINADKQDVSDQEPMLENVPLWFTRISVKLRLPPKKEKDQEPTTNASATTTTNTDKIEVVSNSVKDPLSDLLLNDAPSFDLGLTPTPPDVKLDTDTKPMLENERVKKNAKVLGPTNTNIAFDAMPLSFAMPNSTLVTHAIKRKRQDFDRENILKEANDKESKKMK
ncbi:hypothetical protein Tco_0819778 [Tanacetum coccineum]|uniref:Uncharacterized protein n=1 Tax=Tanacetum coccineum TaxID=301880 RepID=A0ABQ5A9A2_9ASTR